jgi:prevent-host-death family protein
MSEVKVGIRELKARLSEYLRLVKAGSTVVITDRGKPVGQILPVGQSLEEKMQRLVDAGLAEWSGEKFQPGEPLAVNKGEKPISDLISEDREIDYIS